MGAAPLIQIASFEDIATALDQRLGEDQSSGRREHRQRHIAGRRYRQSARPGERRSGRPGRQRSVRDGGGAPRQRHSHRARPRRAGRADAHRRPSACRPDPERHSPASRHLPDQDHGGSQHCRAPAAAGWRRAVAGRARGNRHACRHHADAARRIRRHPPAAEGSGSYCPSRSSASWLAMKGKLRRLLTLPHGMIIVTGPTGSGKTTTLATILSLLNEPTRKVLTIEDPVEYEIPGISQYQAKPSIGLTFATALRAFVRQDPGRDHGRRGARRRNRACRDSRGADRPSGADHAAYRDGGRRGTAPSGSRGRGVSAALDAARGHRPATGSSIVRPMQGGPAADGIRP